MDLLLNLRLSSWPFRGLLSPRVRLSDINTRVIDWVNLVATSQFFTMFIKPLAFVTVLSYVLAAPSEYKRALPTPVSAATARTYLAACASFAS